MAVRLWPTLPKDHELNGLVALERPLLDDREGPYYFVAEVNRRRATIDDDEDATTPTIRVLHGEALLGEFSAEARDLLKRAQAARLPKRKPPAEPAPAMFDRDGEPAEGAAPGPGDDPIQRHIDRVNGLDLGDDPDGDSTEDEPADAAEDDADGGTAPSTRFLAAVSDE